MFLRCMGSVKVEGRLCRDQEDVVCSDVHNGSLNGLLAGTWGPGGAVRDEGVFHTDFTLLPGVGSQQPLHILSTITENDWKWDDDSARLSMPYLQSWLDFTSNAVVGVFRIVSADSHRGVQQVTIDRRDV